MNNQYLVGADAVERAGGVIQKAAATMEDAAEKMRRAVADMDFHLINHQRFLDDWLRRFREVLEDVLPMSGEPIDVRVVRDAEDPPAAEAKIPATIPAPATTVEHDYVQEGPID